jgi:uncharacterized alkaline shock family protein YloU
MTEQAPTPGRTTIAPNVLLTIARLTTLKVDGISHLSSVPGGFNRLFKRNQNQGIRINVEDGIVDVDLYVVLNSDVNVREVSRKLQKNVKRAISDMVGMEVGQINVHIDDIKFDVN